MEELNKKLAGWAGFTYRETTPDWALAQGKPSDMGWIDPRGSWYGHKINFTNSLDACFKWLVLKARAEFGDDELDATLDENGITISNLDAPALCLAIEKLIDGGKDGTI